MRRRHLVDGVLERLHPAEPTNRTGHQPASATQSWVRRQTTIEEGASGWRRTGSLFEVGTPGGHRRAESVTGRGQLGSQFVVAGLERADLVLQLEDAAYALDADSSCRQRCDLAEQLDVAVAVAPTTATGTARHDQAHPLVGAQRLRVQPGELGRHADHIDGRVGAGHPRLTPWHRRPSRRGWRAACRRLRPRGSRRSPRARRR